MRARTRDREEDRKTAWVALGKGQSQGIGLPAVDWGNDPYRVRALPRRGKKRDYLPVEARDPARQLDLTRLSYSQKTTTEIVDDGHGQAVRA